MKNIPHIVLGLSLALVGCTDLSKVDKDDEKDPLESVSPEKGAPEKIAGVTQETVSYPFGRVIKDLSGRSIEATILAKSDSKIGFEKVSGTQKFILPLDRLSEADQAFFKGIYDGGDFQSVSEAISRAARLGNREAAWNRDIVSAEREAEKLKLPRLTMFLIEGDSRSETLESNLLFSREFRKWAGQNLVLCSIPVEPPESRMAITSTMAENRRVADLYGVSDSASLVLDTEYARVSLGDVVTVADIIKAIEKVLEKQRR